MDNNPRKNIPQPRQPSPPNPGPVGPPSIVKIKHYLTKK